MDRARTARETQGHTSIAGGGGSIYRGSTTTCRSDYLRARTPATEPGPLALHGGPAPDRPGTLCYIVAECAQYENTSKRKECSPAGQTTEISSGTSLGDSLPSGNEHTIKDNTHFTHVGEIP